MGLTENEITALISAFNGIIRDKDISAKSHLTNEFSWYFSDKAKADGIDYETDFSIKKSEILPKLEALTEDEASDLLKKYMRFWGLMLMVGRV